MTIDDSSKTSFNGVFSRLGCYKKESSELAGINKAGTIFFGIDANYIANVQMKEIFELIGYGFDYNSLKYMSVEKRRYYYHLLVIKNSPKDDGQTPPGNSKVDFKA